MTLKYLTHLFLCLGSPRTPLLVRVVLEIKFFADKKKHGLLEDDQRWFM